MAFAFIQLTLWENKDTVRVNVNKICAYNRPMNMSMGRWLVAGRSGSYVTVENIEAPLHVLETPEEIDELISKLGGV